MRVVDRWLACFRFYRRWTGSAWYRVRLGGFLGCDAEKVWTRVDVRGVGLLTIVDVERWDRRIEGE
jgi:hypothetical protein